MKHSLLFLLLILVLIGGCTVAPSSPQDSTLTPTPVISTHYPMPTGLPTSDAERSEIIASISPDEADQNTGESATTYDGGALLLKPSLQIGKGIVTSLAVSPDGRWLSVGTPLGVYLYKADTFEQVWFLGFPRPVESISFDSTSKYLGVISDRSIYAIDIEFGKISDEIEDAGSSFAWSPDGRRLVSGGECQTVSIWEMFPAKKLRELRGGLCSEGYSRIKVVWAPNGAIYATLSGTEIYSWDGTSLNQQNNLSIEGIQDSKAGIIAASPRGNLLAHYDGLGGSMAAIIDLNTGAAMMLDGNINGPIDAIEWAPDGYRLAVSYGMNTNQTLIWDTRNGTVIKRIDGMKFLGGIGWTPDGKTLIGLQTLDGSLTAVDVNTGKVENYLSGHESISGSLTWNQAGLIGAVGNILTVWDPSSGEILQQENVGSSDMRLLSWSSASPDNFLFISDLGEYTIGNASARKPFQGKYPLPLSWSPDGKSIAGRDRVWDVQTGNILTNLYPQISQNERDLIAWSPDGTRLAFASSLNRNSPIIRDAKSGEILLSLQEPDGIYELVVQNLAWSPDGQFIAGVVSYYYGSPHSIVLIWDAKTGTLYSKLTSYVEGYRLQTVTWSPDGHFLATGSTGNELLVWNMDSLMPEYSLTGHALPVEQIAWSPDSSQLAAVSTDGTIMIWNLGLLDS